MNVWYTNFILLHLVDIWQNRKDVTNMARKVIERNISYDDIRKKYYVNLDYGVIDGKRKKKTEVFTKKSDARRRLTEFQHQKNTTGIAAPSDDTLADWLDYWLENIVKVNNEVTTYESYKNIVKYLKADMGGIKLQKLTARRIQQYYNDRIQGRGGTKLSGNTVKKHHTLLKTALKLAVKQDVIYKNPADLAEPPKYTRPEISVYSVEEIKKLFNVVENDIILKTAVSLAALLGLRREEICGLKWSNVDFLTKEIHIIEAKTIAGSDVIEKSTKNASSNRTLYMDNYLCQILSDIKQQQEKNRRFLGDMYNENDYVEVDETGKPVNPGYLSSRFRKCIITNELPHITLHGLRHSVASIANEAGITLFNISKMLGHSSPDVTGKVYTHLFDETNKEAFGKIAEALK